MNEKRKAMVFAGLAIFVLIGGCLVALFLPKLQVAIVAASFVGYVACTRRALVLCRADELVFASGSSGARERVARAAVRAGLVAGTFGSVVFGRAMASGSSPSRVHGLRKRPPFLRALEGATLPKSR
jgi:hypothetical protein